MMTTESRKYVVQEGWREEADFSGYADAMLFVAVMEDLYPARKFDIWLDAGTGMRRVMLREGQPVVEGKPIFIGHGFWRQAKWNFEAKKKWRDEERHIRILRTIPADEQESGKNW